jgi:hypothetical protein
MKTKIYLLSTIVISILFTSCKKCRVCDCTKNGVTQQQKACGTGLASNKATLDKWENNLKQSGDWDDVKCHDE